MVKNIIAKNIPESVQEALLGIQERNNIKTANKAVFKAVNDYQINQDLIYKLKQSLIEKNNHIYELKRIIEKIKEYNSFINSL